MILKRPTHKVGDQSAVTSVIQLPTGIGTNVTDYKKCTWITWIFAVRAYSAVGVVSSRTIVNIKIDRIGSIEYRLWIVLSTACVAIFALECWALIAQTGSSCSLRKQK
jgi:hypothetical protein